MAAAESVHKPFFDTTPILLSTHAMYPNPQTYCHKPARRATRERIADSELKEKVSSSFIVPENVEIYDIMSSGGVAWTNYNFENFVATLILNNSKSSNILSLPDEEFKVKAREIAFSFIESNIDEITAEQYGKPDGHYEDEITYFKEQIKNMIDFLAQNRKYYPPGSEYMNLSITTERKKTGERSIENWGLFSPRMVDVTRAHPIGKFERNDVFSKILEQDDIIAYEPDIHDDTEAANCIALEHIINELSTMNAGRKITVYPMSCRPFDSTEIEGDVENAQYLVDIARILYHGHNNIEQGVQKPLIFNGKEFNHFFSKEDFDIVKFLKNYQQNIYRLVEKPQNRQERQLMDSLIHLANLVELETLTTNKRSHILSSTRMRL